MSNFWINDGETMLFIGDSITDCGRRAAEAPLGNGYVRIFTEMVTARFPESSITWINRGIGGNRITDLKERWADDVLYHKPDKLSVKIGINDLSSYLRSAPDAVTPEIFERTYDELLATTRDELGIPVVLITPFYISTARDRDTMRGRYLETLPTYIDVVKRMSRKYDTLLVELNDRFQSHLKHRPADYFCPEPVHPKHSGHLVIADALFQTLIE